MNLKLAKQKLIQRLRIVGGCWEWQRCIQKTMSNNKAKKGYGMIAIEGRIVLTHRLAWEVFRGPIPYKMLVCHHCDNPPCCNPSHLFIGTVKDNSRDCKQKKRHPRGESHGGAKLTKQDVKEIRCRYKGMYGEMELIAKEKEVNVATIRKILRGETWKEEIEGKGDPIRYNIHAKRPPRPIEVRNKIRKALQGRPRPQQVIDRIKMTLTQKKV
jgi:hypothetical protein